MESGAGCWDFSSLVEVLTQGEDQLRQLDACLDVHSPVEHKKQLLLRVQSSFKRAISMTRAIESDRLRQGASFNKAGLDSPHSNSGGGSLRSENSDRAFKERERREMCKKRKTLRKWSNQVRISLGGAMDGLDDGYSWRKYGQKDILGAKHPRGYFRCTHRKTAGCLAMKQVQRSDDDHSVFDITYRGEHTCGQRPRTIAASVQLEPDMQQSQEEQLMDHQQQHATQQDQQLLFGFQRSLKVKTEGLSLEEQDHNSPFSFPSTPVSSFMSENNIMSSPPTLEQSFMGSFSNPFMLPTTPESKYFPLPPCRMGSFGGTPSLHATESKFTDIIAATTSANDSSTVDIAFMLDSAGFDPAFPFDASNFFHNL